MRRSRKSVNRTRKKVYRAALHGANVRREQGIPAAVDYFRSSKYQGNRFAIFDAFMAILLMDASTESEVLEGVELAEKVRLSTIGEAPPRLLEASIRVLVELAVIRAWVADLGDPRTALEVLRRVKASWPDETDQTAITQVRVFLAQAEPSERTVGVSLASELLLSGGDWLMTVEEAKRGDRANDMAMALVQVPITETRLISEAERLAEFAIDSTGADSVSATSHTLALVRIRQGKIAEAVQLLRPLLGDEELIPRHYDEVLLTLALALTMLGHVDEALDLLENGRRADLKPSVLSELQEALASDPS